MDLGRPSPGGCQASLDLSLQAVFASKQIRPRRLELNPRSLPKMARPLAQEPFRGARHARGITGQAIADLEGLLNVHQLQVSEICQRSINPHQR